MTRHDVPDDELMSRFSEVLNSEAERHQPTGDSLARIRERVPTTTGRTSRRWVAPLAMAAAVVGIAAAAALLPNDEPVATPLPGTSTTPSPIPSLSGCSSLVAPIPVPVYFASNPNGSGPRLYREFSNPSVCEIEELGPVGVAVTKMLEGTTSDPDYSSLWPTQTRLLSVDLTDGTATVDLSNVVDLGAQVDQAALQQLVWTVTAADTSIKQVRLLIEGTEPAAGSGWSGAPMGRGNSLDTLANVWILAPTQGAEVGSPVTIRVYGTGFEGNVPIKVFQSGTEVASTFVTTEMGGFAEASTTIDLPPGSYQIRAYNDNGQDATLQLWDTKDFTVR